MFFSRVDPFLFLPLLYEKLTVGNVLAPGFMLGGLCPLSLKKMKREAKETVGVGIGTENFLKVVQTHIVN